MKSQKGQKGKSETAGKVSTPMNQTLPTDIRDLILPRLKKVEVAV